VFLCSCGQFPVMVTEAYFMPGGGGKLRDMIFKNKEANIKRHFTADTQKYFCVPHIQPRGRRRRKLLNDLRERKEDALL